MPSVSVDLTISAPAYSVWKAIKDIRAYPNFMENVEAVEILREDGHERESQWTTLLKGSVLKWTERELIDDDAMTIEFHQLDGDLDKFDGFWRLEERDGAVAVTLEVEFEIGIPLLADMLNPVAARSLRENSESMLRSIEFEVID